MTNETMPGFEKNLTDSLNNALAGILPPALESYKNLLMAALIVLCSVVAARIVYFFIEKYFKKLAEKTESKADDEILELIHKPVYYIIILLGIQLAVGFLLVSGTYLDYFTKFVSILFILIFTYLIAGVIDILIKEFGTKLTAKTETTLDDEALPFLSKIVKVTVYGLGIMIVLDQLGIPITPLVASLGIAGFALGFAAKDTIANLLAGFFILTDRPFVRGDRIAVGSFQGEVVDIGLRSTKIQTPDHTFVIVPNEKIISNEVTNYALPDPRLKVSIKFGVAYGSDVEKVRKVALGVVRRSSNVLKDPEPQVFFRELGDSSLNFSLVAWINTFKDQLKVTDELNTGIYNAFAKEGIEIPYPSTTVYLKKES